LASFFIMKNKIQYFILSDGYRGGAITFLESQIKYLNSKKKNLIIVDKNPQLTYSGVINNNQFFKLDLNKNIKTNKQKLEKIIFLNSKNNKRLLLTNFALIIKYFSFFKLFKKYSNNKIILTVHSGILNSSLKSYLGALMFSFIYKKIDYLIFGSNSSKLWWQNSFPWMNLKKNIIRYNGVKSINQNFKKKKLKKILSVSFVGRVEKENNPHFFIKIANEYLKNDKNAFFNIYGDGSYLDELKKKNNNKNIIFHGWCNKEVVYRNSDIVIITSPINNYPYVALEAKSYGIPVISCSNGDIKKIITNNFDGYLDPYCTEKDMVYMIMNVKKNYEKFSKNSIKSSKNYNEKNLCKKFWNSIT